MTSELLKNLRFIKAIMTRGVYYSSKMRRNVTIVVLLYGFFYSVHVLSNFVYQRMAVLTSKAKH